MIALGAPLQETLSELLRFLERDTPEMLCSLLLLAPDGLHMRHCAALSLPADYSRSIDGAAIGPQAGSCGTAAYRRQRVVVTDIESDPCGALSRPCTSLRTAGLLVDTDHRQSIARARYVCRWRLQAAGEPFSSARD